jgi:hypothetical protein
LHERGKSSSYETRLKVKFRKATVKTLEKAIEKIKIYVETIKKELGDI